MNTVVCVFLCIMRSASAPEPTKRQQRRAQCIASLLIGGTVFVERIPPERRGTKDRTRMYAMAARMKRRRIVH